MESTFERATAVVGQELSKPTPQAPPPSQDGNGARHVMARGQAVRVLFGQRMQDLQLYRLDSVLALQRHGQDLDERSGGIRSRIAPRWRRQPTGA